MKERIYDSVVQLTKQGKIQKSNAQFISEKLKVSRNIVSQYLNEYYNDGIFLKINTRPVIFVHLASLEEQYRIHISCNICASVEEFEKMIENEKKKDFEYLIVTLCKVL